MKKVSIIISIVIGTGFWVGLECQTLTSGGDFLKIPVGGRNASMAEASVAVVNDIEAISVNPAGMANIKGLQIAYEHQEWFQSVRFESLSGAIPLKMIFPGKMLPGVAGLIINYLYVPPIEIYDSWSEPIDSIKFNGFQFRLGYALMVFRSDLFEVMAGGNISFISKGMKASELNVKGQTKPAVDLSAQAKIFHGNADIRKIIGDYFTAGFVIRNIDFYSTGPNENWPTLIKLGFAAKIYDLVLLDIDLAKDLSSPFAATFGAEYWLKNLVAFRLGGKLQSAQSSHLSVGVGFKYKIRDYTMFLDYALIPFENGLEPTHKISFKVDISKIEIRDNTDILYYRGVDYFVHGQYQEALEMWEKVLKKNPEHAEAKKRIEETRKILELEKEEQKTRQEIETGKVELEPAYPTPDTVKKKKK